MRRAARETPGEVVTMSARTDLALEAKELREAAEQPLPAGVRCTERREKPRVRRDFRRRIFSTSLQARRKRVWSLP